MENTGFLFDYPSSPPSAPSSSYPSSSMATASMPSSVSYSYSVSFGDWSSTNRRSWGSVVSRLASKLVCAILTCIFAIVGSFVGAITGALIGLATESGLFRGAGIGAISGAVFTIEAVESSLAIWRSNGPGIWSLLILIDIVRGLLSGTLVREKVGPAVQSAVQSQMSAVDTPFQEVLDIFEVGGGTKGMSRDSVDKLPKIVITEENNVDGSGERICCSVCLQDFEVEESVRSLPKCQHMFHLPCIDNWLMMHGSCPLCRRDF